MSREDLVRRVSAALDMPGGLASPIHKTLREELELASHIIPINGRNFVDKQNELDNGKS